MKRSMTLLGASLVCALMWSSPTVRAFCGFYVAKADVELFNQASQVVLVRHRDKTVITMVNDFRGEPKEFAMVVPVPTFIEREQIHVTNNALIDHLDAFTSPRLVEYFDGDPCMRVEEYDFATTNGVRRSRGAAGKRARANALGVNIEAQYIVGEYDIIILSAEQSDGLQTWLEENGYRTPPGASRVLASYIRQNVRFFVAKVNLKEQSRLGFNSLRPLQVAFESPKFMLPIRLGTINANGPQDLVLYTLTRNGRVETTNYRTVKLPTGMNVPVFTKNEFGDFYKAMFAEQVRKENMRSVFLEYAWDMSWCDPCAADPLSSSQLRELGVFWIGDNVATRRGKAGAQNAFVTRLHVRYDGEHFPEDLVFQETSDRSNFQGRYVLQHPYQGAITCGADGCLQQVREREEREAQTLASLTGWDIRDIRTKMNLDSKPQRQGSWWQRLWKQN